MQFMFQKFFIKELDEINWLNKMAQRGLLLVKRAPLIYYLSFNNNDDKNYKYKIVYMHDAIANGASDDELKLLPEDGSKMACSYKNRAYLLIASDESFDEYNDNHARYKHYLSIWSFYLVLFIASLSAFAYHAGYVVEMMLKNKPIPSRLVVAITLFVLIGVSVFFAYYLDKTMFWNKKYKNSKFGRTI